MQGLLISCCNVGGPGEGYFLAHRALDTGETRWVRLTDVLQGEHAELMSAVSGTTGICQDEDSIFVALQGLHNPSYVVELDHRLRYKRLIEAPDVSDIHSMRLYDGALFIASTGNNSVVRVPLDAGGTAQVHAQLPSTDLVNNCHLNDFIRFDGKDYVLGHSNPFLNVANRSGFVYCLSDQTIVLEGLDFPHTMMEVDGDLLILNSAKCDVYSLARNAPVFKIPSQTILRGCARDGDVFHFGLSSRRLFSRKQGVTKAVLPAGAPVFGNEQYMAWLYASPLRSGEGTGTGTGTGDQNLVAAGKHSFSEFAFEIYDVAPLVERPAESSLLPGPAAALRAQSNRQKIFTMARAAARDGRDELASESKAAADTATVVQPASREARREQRRLAKGDRERNVTDQDSIEAQKRAAANDWSAEENIRIVAKPGQHRTIIAFAGLASLVGGMAPFNFIKSLEELDANFIFVRDPERTWYNGPIAKVGADPSSIVDTLRGQVEALGTRELYLLGASSGGFAALAYAGALGATRVLAFGPQSNIDLGYLESVGETRWLQNIRRIKDPTITDVVDRVVAATPGVLIDLIIGTRSDLDVVYAERLLHIPGVTIHRVPSTHNSAAFLKRHDRLASVLREFVEGKPLDSLESLKRERQGTPPQP